MQRKVFYHIETMTFYLMHWSITANRNIFGKYTHDQNLVNCNNNNNTNNNNIAKDQFD